MSLSIPKSLSHQAIDYSKYKFTFIVWLRLTLIALAGTAVLAFTFYRQLFAWILMLPFVIIYPFYKKTDLINARKRRLSIEFKEAILVLSGCLSAGYSPENALRESVEELVVLYGKDCMIVKEFEYLYHRVCTNIPIEKAFEEFAQRSSLDDIRMFASVLRIAKRSGGELVSIINHTADTIGDKIKMEEDIRTMTAAKRFEQSIMNIIPILIVIYIDLTSPGFFDLMYSTIIGRIIMTVCLVAYIVAVLMAKKILKIEI